MRPLVPRHDGVGLTLVCPISIHVHSLSAGTRCVGVAIAETKEGTWAKHPFNHLLDVRVCHQLGCD